MNIGLLADLHYSSAPLTCGVRQNSRSLEKLAQALAYFAAENCEMVILLGDITDTEATHQAEAENLQKIRALLDASPLKTLCLMGNHDAFSFTPEEFYALLGESRRPIPLHFHGCHLLFLDACHFHTGIHYAPGDSDWTDTFYPYTYELRQTLSDMTGNVFVFLHQNIDPLIPENHLLSNHGEIRRILEDSGKVRAVYQGHYHPGHETVCRSILYHTLPAACENQQAWEIIRLPSPVRQTDSANPKPF